MKDPKVHFFRGDSLDFYKRWEPPSVLVVDGPYGIGGFAGDPTNPNLLDAWYEPHIEQWSKYSKPGTTLWFWCSEIGWANVHRVFEKYNWQYKTCNVWDKGIGHIAGNSNSKNLSKLPVVTEICVHYVKKPEWKLDGKTLQTKEWLRHEWSRTGMPLYITNRAAGVKDAAIRKYFTLSDLWYPPPGPVFQKMVDFANNHGDKSGVPYFTVDGKKSITGPEWDRMRATFKCPIGVTNVWKQKGLRGAERIKIKNGKAVHINQKPLALMKLIIEMSSDPGDTVWEPFGGLCSASVAAVQLNRSAYCAEIDENYAEYARNRLEKVAFNVNATGPARSVTTSLGLRDLSPKTIQPILGQVYRAT